MLHQLILTFARRGGGGGDEEGRDEHDGGHWDPENSDLNAA